MTIYVQLLVALVGVLMFALCTSQKLQRIGEILFFCGMLSSLMLLRVEAVNFLK